MLVRSDLYSQISSSTAKGAGAGGREDVELGGRQVGPIAVMAPVALSALHLEQGGGILFHGTSYGSCCRVGESKYSLQGAWCSL